MSADLLPANDDRLPSVGDRRRARCTHHQLLVCGRSDPMRVELERFVQDAFVARHGAHVCSFMPTLLAMHGNRGVCGVAGFRRAADEPLFLERYLDRPIEAAIEAATKRGVPRSQIVEVGNLAGLSCRAAVRLVLELPQLLLAQGHRWIVFTATEQVRQLLGAFRAPLIELAPARATCVAGLGDDWGRYYETDPRVMVGYLEDGLAMHRQRQASK